MEFKLGEIATFSQGKQVDLEEQYNDNEGNRKRFIRIVDYTNTNEPIRFVDDYGKRYYADKDDLVMIRYGSQTAGKVVMGKEGIIANNMFKINLDNQIVSNKYMYYYLSQKGIFNYLRGAQSSSTMPAINFTMLNNFIVNLPVLSIQEKVVKVLDKIDKKIELNNQINNNLFEFAISYLSSKQEKNEVPISKFANIQGGYAFKSKDLVNKSTENRIIKIKNLRNEINADVINSQFVDNKIINNIDNKFKLNKGDVTIAMTGAELGKTGFIYGFDKYYLNQRVGVIRGKNKEKELFLKIIFLSNQFQVLLNSKGYGSAQPNISTSDIENVLINDITEDNLKKLYEKLNPIYYKIISNCEENLNLEQLRDTLLPKLMNGKIDLEKIEA